MLAEVVPKERISVGWLGPVIGAHVGQGTIAVAEHGWSGTVQEADL
jgi:fatty acid-binding protein DegV